MKNGRLFRLQKSLNSIISKIYVLTLVLLGLILIGSINILAQSEIKNPDRGAKVGNAYAMGDFETINTTNGNLMLNFPLGSLPAGRGEVGAGVNLIYSSKLYDSGIKRIKDWRYNCTYEIEGYERCQYFQKTVIKQSDKGGWKYSGVYKMEFEDRRTRYGNQPPDCMGTNNHMTEYWEEMTYVWKMRMVFPDGSAHEMVPYGHTDQLNDRFFRVRPDGLLERCGLTPEQNSQPLVYYSVDGTYMRLEFSSGTWTLYFPDGRKVVDSVGNAQRIYDRNNNYVEIGEGFAQDQFGRSVSTRVGSNGDDEIVTKGVGGEELVWTVKWKQIAAVKTYQACDDPHCPTQEQRGNLHSVMTVVDKITKPQQLGGGTYTFSYNAPAYQLPLEESDGWGEVSGVTLSTGSQTNAQISYTYAMDNQDGPLNASSTPDILKNYPTSKTLTYDQEYDGLTTPVTEVWGYGTGPTEGLIGAPDGSITTNYFGNTNENSWRSGLTFKTVSSTGVMTEKLWEQNFPAACPQGNTYCQYGASNNPYVKTEFTSIKDASGSYTLTAIKDFTYDKNGNVTQIAEYDWEAYSNIPRDQYGQITGIPTGIPPPKRIIATGYYAETPDASVTTTDGELYIWGTSPKLKNTVKWTEVRNGGNQPVSRTEITYDDASNTGNPTVIKVWDSAKANLLTENQQTGSRLDSTNSISTSTAYNPAKLPETMTDAKGVQTTITYGNISGPNGNITDLYPTQIETASNYSALKRTTTAVYDFYTGLVTTATDVDNAVSTETDYDDLGRPVKVKAAVGTPLEIWTTTEYDDIYRRIITRSDIETKGDGKRISVQHFDQLGRVRLSRSIENVATEDPYNEAHGVKVQTRYQTGDPYSYQWTSNPYRAATSSAATNEPSMGWTRSKTINTGKYAETETFSGAAFPGTTTSSTNSTGIVKTYIDTDRTLVADQAGRQRISRINALGQLTDVWEITAAEAGQTEAITFGNPAVSLNGLKTSYEYDTLSNLKTVNQGSQTRSFTYSSLSRLLSATNPEMGTTPTNGTINYSYDNNGNLLQKIDARPVTTNYSYDALNRVMTRTYSDGTPEVTYTYDNVTNAKGKLTKVSSSVSETRYTAFDKLGRVTASEQSIPFSDTETISTATARTFLYKYNLAGALIEETYPSGRVVRNELDADGSLSVVKSKKSANAGFWNYAQHFSYNAAGAVTSMQLGNGAWESTIFNSRLQPEQIALGSILNGTDKLKLNFDYGTTANNGNVLSQTITVPTVGTETGFTATQTYTYDSLNRLKSATETITGVGQTWKQTYDYDRYGNRNFDEANTTTLTRACGSSPNYTICETDRKRENPVIDTVNNNNRFKEYQDGDGIKDYEYDTAGNTKKDADGKTFKYDAENKQIKVESGSLVIGEYWYDGDGKRVKKYVPSSGETTIFIYDASGKLAAEYSTIVETTNAKVSYLTNDHLGSPRITTNKDGGVISRRDFMPFGEEIYTSQRTTGLSYSGDNVRQKFTGYERDDETELDFAQARMYASQLGRFSTTDPLLSSGRLHVPQSWNRYSYTLNNPVRYSDPSGLFEWDETLADNENLDSAERTRRKHYRAKIVASIESAKQKAKAAFDAGKISKKKYDKINNALNSYGKPDEVNGVTVGTKSSMISTLASRGETDTRLEVQSYSPTTTVKALSHVKFEVLGLLSDDAEAIIVHEGQHVADNFEMANIYNAVLGGMDHLKAIKDSRVITQYATENNAFHAQSYYNEAIGQEDKKWGTWNKGWAKKEEVEQESLRQKAIDKTIKAGYGITPESPGGNMLQLCSKPCKF